MSNFFFISSFRFKLIAYYTAVRTLYSDVQISRLYTTPQNSHRIVGLCKHVDAFGSSSLIRTFAQSSFPIKENTTLTFQIQTNYSLSDWEVCAYKHLCLLIKQIYFFQCSANPNILAGENHRSHSSQILLVHAKTLLIDGR